MKKDVSLLFRTETVSAASVDERYSFNYKSIRGQQTMAVAHVKIDRLRHVHDHQLGAMHVRKPARPIQYEPVHHKKLLTVMKNFAGCR